ncbi:response regulator [Fibrella sp. WM1]|uniref:response regulator n=1 Tax=Fibrella musci TaxID=3242485 RepID=UPI0035207BDA
MADETPSIWLVDDDEDDLQLIRAAFYRAAPDLAIKALQDGDEVLAQLLSSPELPSLIMLDLNMTRTGGFQVLEAMRSDERYNQLPIVVLTTSTNPADKSRSQSLGASDFYSKPDQFDALTQLCQQLVRHWLSKQVD